MENKKLAQRYKNISQRDHVLLRPGMYLGSVNTVEKQSFVYEDGKMIEKKLLYNEGLLKIINETVDNAIDNIFRGNIQTNIKVQVDNGTISVSNDGQHIPIEYNGDRELIPSVIFGKCLSGSNYDDDAGRESIGLNGLGVKLTNICSTDFQVFVVDPVSSKTFLQKWNDNMGNICDPIIKKATKKQLKSDVRTKVTFTPDLSRFGVETLEHVVPYLYTRLVEVSATLQKKVKIYFNGKRINIDNFKDYVRLFAERKNIFFDNTSNIEYGFKVSGQDGFTQHSFVNNTRTSDGGPHVEVVSDTICRVIQKYFKSRMKDQIVRLSKNNILAKLHVFVNYHMLNPQFTSQTKTKLASTIPKIKFNEDTILKSCKKLGILQDLEDKLNERALEIVEKSCSSGKKKTLNIPKLDDAHNAGTSKSTDTLLFLTEGDSAKTFCSTGLSVLKRTNYGVFPLKGKILNVRSASKKQLLENKEIQNIIKILGLSMSKSYENNEDKKSLRYGKVCILSDADYDGFHIAGLFFNFIMHFWPKLATSGYICRFITPVLKATEKRNKKNVFSFFNMKDFEEFTLRENIDSYHVKYFKGLGTSTRDEAIQYFSNIDVHLKSITLDEESFTKCDVMFNPKRSNERKQLIVDAECTQMDYNKKEMPLTSFLDSELLSYSKYSIQRAIPSVMDGLKVSQRKILYSCLKKFSGNNTEYKVSQLASLVSAQTAYLHGEQSLSNAIVNMAQSFTGSNNMPLLNENGSFGSRLQNGSDCASSRYIFTNLREYTRNIFVKQDDDILQYKVEEGMTIEPEVYFPTIPLILCNGSNGISTGFKTDIPMYSVKDIIKNLILKCEANGDYDFVDMTPFYKGFKGSIDKTVDGKYIMSGCYRAEPNSKQCIITEIPTNYSLESYKDKVLDSLVEHGHIASYKVDHVSENEPRFILKGLKDSFKPEMLRLSLTINTQFVLLDPNNKIKVYDGPKHIMDEFFQRKFQALTKRRNWVIENTKKELDFLEQKIDFINGVISNEIDIKSDVSDVTLQCIILGIMMEHVDTFMNLPMVSLTRKKVDELAYTIQSKKCALEKMESKTVYDIYLDDLKALDHALHSKKRIRSNDGRGVLYKKSKLNHH